MCRLDPTFNEPYWDQQVSGGFFYNASDGTSWTPRTWGDASTGVVHMYHSARWGGWQFKLHTRDDTTHALLFQCTLLPKAGEGGEGGEGGKGGEGAAAATAATVACPPEASSQRQGLVHGGWQEARGADIGPQYTNQAFNNSYFIENIREELDYPGEWFFDQATRELLVMPPAGVTRDEFLHTLAPTLVATARRRVVEFRGSSGSDGGASDGGASNEGTQHQNGNGSHGPLPSSSSSSSSSSLVAHVRLENMTIAHSEASFMGFYETPSGGDWSIHRGGSIFIDGATDVAVLGCGFDQVDGNGVFLSRHVRNSSVSRCDFKDVGDTAILVVGASGRHRTNNGLNDQYVLTSLRLYVFTSLRLSSRNFM